LWAGVPAAILRGDDLILLASVGMSACFGATVRAPLTALLMIFEMTHRFAVVPALMIGTVASQAFIHLFGGQWNFYEEALLQDGYKQSDVDPPRDLQSWQAQPVAVVLNKRPVAITDLSRDNLREFLLEHRFKSFPVALNGRYVGIIRRAAMLDALRHNHPPDPETTTICTAGESIAVVAERMVRESADVAICLDEHSGEIAGLVTLRDLFRAQSRAAFA